jgi:hypothetical protein
LENTLTEENYTHSHFTWRTRQAGVSLIFDPERNRYVYNAYCIETELLKELFTCEYEFLEEALLVINQEYGNWEYKSVEEKSGCGSCVAK